MAQRPFSQKAKPVMHGDPAKWVDQYGDALLRYAGARVESREVAEDLVQETFLAAFRHRAQFDGRSAFSTWLVAILRRKISDYHRASGRAVEREAKSLTSVGEPFTPKGRWTISSCPWRAGPKELAENAEFWKIVQGCVSDLPVHLAEAFQMREFGMHSVEEASREIGVSPQNLAVRLHRARLLLRECLDRKWFGGEGGRA
jgi:RNA polymerase sigma-70 factor (TIGR02943 family)